ncbi:MAG TPA: hypothetical protein VID30_07460 [Bradyrhizobium sp.]|jgi:heme-degrading monooxygenase HmoA
MMRLKWKLGMQSDWPGPYFVSATRFTYRSLRTMPLVYWHGLKLRRSWPAVDGAVGLSIMSDLATRTTYTVSVWRSEAVLLAWVRSSAHARLMRAFRARLRSSAADSWQTDHFELRQAWREAMRRVGLPQGDRKMDGASKAPQTGAVE